MPVYEYRCSKGHEYEKTEGFDAPSQQKCITCGAVARRQISMPAVIFKGTGFYSTDNRGSSGRSTSGDSESAAVSTPAPASDDGPGHSHGDGGHSHASDKKLEATA